MLRMRLYDPFYDVPDFSRMIRTMERLMSELEEDEKFSRPSTRLRGNATSNPVTPPPSKPKSKPEQNIPIEEVKPKEEDKPTEKSKVERAEELFSIIPDDKKTIPDKKIFNATSKPTNVECMRWDGSKETLDDMYVWSGRCVQIINGKLYMFPPDSVSVNGILIAEIGDFIMKTGKDEFSVIKETDLLNNYDF